ncbi:MAG: hypothetical protein ABH805_01740 [Candidatus Nealsonbacteria bacterium]
MEISHVYSSSTKPGQLWSVTIEIANYRIKFTEETQGGKLIWEYKMKLDASVLFGKSLSVPQPFYEKAKSQAYAFISEKRSLQAALR